MIPKIVSIDGLMMVYEHLENGPKLNPMYIGLMQMSRQGSSEMPEERPILGEKEQEIMTQVLKHGTFPYPKLKIDSPIEMVGFVVSRLSQSYSAQFYIGADAHEYRGISRRFAKVLSRFNPTYSFQQINESGLGRIFEGDRPLFGIQGEDNVRKIGIGCNGIPKANFGTVEDFVGEIKGNEDRKREGILSLEDVANIFLEVCYNGSILNLREPYHLTPGLI